jgi:hypothetical protein
MFLQTLLLQYLLLYTMFELAKNETPERDIAQTMTLTYTYTHNLKIGNH